ncbi:MAG TPA: tetratricopeptide repeat protein [Gemmatimonadaceae bacterium]|nr:tetratricopeptide repeat protein [Gemmatimonadaceae bacterium]
MELPPPDQRDPLAMLGESHDVRLLISTIRRRGNEQFHRGETAAAAALYEQSLSIAWAVGYVAGIAHALNCKASVVHRRGDFEEAEQLYNDAAIFAEQAAERRLIGMVQQNLGILASIRGHWDAALACYRLSLAAFDAEGDAVAASWVLNNMGKLHGERGETALAEQCFVRAGEIARERGDLLVESVVEQNRAELLLMQRRLDEATVACSRAFALAHERGDRLRIAETLKLRAKLERERGDYDHAIATLEEARRVTNPTQDALLAAELLCEIGEVWRRRGERMRAGAMWAEALAAFERVGALPAAADAGARLRSVGGGAV